MKQPTPFGKYLLIDRVNVGGMAEVYKAKVSGVEGFERLIAIKRILPNIAEDDEFITMFIDEAKISVQLQHANVAQIYDLGKIGESYFIAMEYISGKDVRAIFDRMRRRGEILPIPMTCYIVGRLCEGLDYAHRKKDAAGRDLLIVHRDISPQNVLVSFEGEVKVIDFGIAKAANKASRTQAGILKGKFGYMSPEQVRGLPLDRRSDIFAVGVCLYEMLTGERLFVGESDFSTLEKVRNVEVIPPSTYNRRIDEKLEGIVMKALAKDVDDRYQWCTDVQESLQRYLITSDTIFSRQDLASFMKSAFAEDLEREKIRNQVALSASLGTDLSGGPEVEDEGLDVDVYDPPAGDRTEVFDPGVIAAPANTDPGTGSVTGPGALPPDPGGGSPHPGMPAAAPPAYPVGTPGSAAQAPFTPDGGGTLPGVSPAPMPPRAAPQEAMQQSSTQPRAPIPQAPVPGSTPLSADAIGGVPSALHPISVPQELRTIAEGRRPISEVRSGKPPPVGSRVRQGGAGRGLILALAFVVVLGLGGGVAWWMTRSAATLRTGSLIVRGTPRRSAVYLNDAPAGTIPFIDSRRAVGTYTVRVEHDGYEPANNTVTVEAGKTATVDVNLAKAGGGLAEVLVIPVPLDAKVFFDGELVKDGGSQPWQNIEIEAGKEHTVIVRKIGYREQTLVWTPGEGSRKTFTASLVAATAQLRVESVPSGASVLVDGRRRGKTPLTLDALDVSRPLTLEISRRGCFQTWRQQVEFGAAEREKTVTAMLKEKPGCGKGTRGSTGGRKGRDGRSVQGAGRGSTKVVGKGMLRLNAKPGWANVKIDGKKTGRRTPLLNYELPAGKHTIVLEAPDGRIKTVTVTIRADEVTTKIVSLQ